MGACKCSNSKGWLLHFVYVQLGIRRTEGCYSASAVCAESALQPTSLTKAHPIACWDCGWVVLRYLFTTLSLGLGAHGHGASTADTHHTTLLVLGVDALKHRCVLEHVRDDKEVDL